jgi:hypothetical protein
MGDRKSPDSKDERKARKRHRDVGREGLQPFEPVQPKGNEQGLGHEGVDQKGRQTKDIPRDR